MGVTFVIRYHPKVKSEDIPLLSTVWKYRIKKAIEEKLTVTPENFGKPLRQSLRGYRKLRVGDYRIVFRIEGTTVVILAILHRSVVYKDAARRG
jgi:mRNA interferase RelE/StbE